MRRLALVPPQEISADAALNVIDRTAHIGTYDIDRVAGTRVWSDAMRRIMGFASGDPLDRTSYMSRVHPDDEPTVRAAFSGAFSTGHAFRFDHRIVRAGADERWIEVTGHPVADAGGAIVRMYGTAIDITARKSAEQRLDFLAHHDGLTGLPNRELLAEKLAAAVAAASARDRRVAVVFVDLDNFKRVNDTYGHGEGDRVIRRCAERLVACTRSADVVARVGGDEFVVVLGDLDHPAAATNAVQRMRAALAEPISIGTILMGLRASFGISRFPDDGTTPDRLIQYADLAMYQAKKTRRGDFAYFEPALQEAAIERLRLEHELGDAIKNGELVVHYQPIVDARTQRVEGVEALVRWPHAIDGLRPPASFIPLAEETGLIVPLGAYVLGEAMRDIAELQRAGYPELRLSVNLSLRQLADDALPVTVRGALACSGMRGDLLDLEITESFLVADPALAAAQLTELTALGIRIALDDFGTGYSALTFVRQFPVHVLKLDRSFVSDISQSEISRTIASTIIELASKLGMRSVAEGVETAEQRHVLHELGCDAFQGFYFAPPMTAAELPAYLKARR